jgi:outer membrane protein assembly factor BamB
MSQPPPQQPPYPPQHQPPYQQPQYGYPAPPQPQQPAAPQPSYYLPPPSPRGGGNGKLIGVVVASAVSLVAVVGGVLVAASDEEPGQGGHRVGPISASGPRAPGGSAIRAKSLWTATTGRPPGAESRAVVPDAWFTGNAIVKTMPDSVTSYDIDSGDENWSIPLSGASCPASRESSDDRIVVQYGAKCARAMAIDIVKGTKLWDKKLPVEEGRTNFAFSQIAVSGDTAALSWMGGGSAGYEISTGKLLWTPKAGASCRDVGYKGGAKLVAIVQCGIYSDPAFYVQGISATGVKQWSWEVPAGNEVSSVVSSDPVVVGLVAGSSTSLTDLVHLEDGTLKSRISLGNGGLDARYLIDCHVLGEGRCQDYAVDSDTIYLPTRTHSVTGSSYNRTNEIAAFDLATGKAKWLARPDLEREVTVVGIESGKVIGYQEPTYNQPGRLIAVDTATHQVTPYMELPSVGRLMEDVVGATNAYLWLYKEHFFVTTASVRAAGVTGVTGSTTKSVAAFG